MLKQVPGIHRVQAQLFLNRGPAAYSDRPSVKQCSVYDGLRGYGLPSWRPIQVGNHTYGTAMLEWRPFTPPSHTDPWPLLGAFIEANCEITMPMMVVGRIVLSPS